MVDFAEVEKLNSRNRDKAQNQRGYDNYKPLALADPCRYTFAHGRAALAAVDRVVQIFRIT